MIIKIFQVLTSPIFMDKTQIVFEVEGAIFGNLEV